MITYKTVPCKSVKEFLEFISPFNDEFNSRNDSENC